ncbi:CAPA peptides-like [Leptopilina heterotoma]|uniref:CAPA peptides-like n=1 Tax=Leptopilina heterotoma TaxID=63436 RepID=UPI001CA8BA37|nr:CAPA peptides-like [Leptopilina heterotoma]
MKYLMLIRVLIFFLALTKTLSANIVPKLKQSDRRAIGLVPYPRVGRSRRENFTLIIKNPWIGRSFKRLLHTKCSLYDNECY